VTVGDLVCDPDIAQSKYGYITDRTTGLIIGDGNARNFEPPSYCGCYEDKFLVWWINANVIFEQCSCELQVINND